MPYYLVRQQQIFVRVQRNGHQQLLLGWEKWWLCLCEAPRIGSDDCESPPLVGILLCQESLGFDCGERFRLKGI
jgi:hypothetical protein